MRLLKVKKVKNRRRSSVVEDITEEKRKMLAYTVWVHFKAMVTKKTLKEKSTVTKYSNNNYKLV